MREFLAYAAPNFKVPSRRTLARNINKLGDETKVRLESFLDTISYVSTTADSWSSHNRAFLGMTFWGHSEGKEVLTDSMQTTSKSCSSSEETCNFWMKRVFQPSWIWGMGMTRMRITRMRMRMSSNFVTTYCLICFFSFENKLKSWNPTIPSPIFSWERWVIQHFFAQRSTGWATSGRARSENGNPKNECMSVSDPWQKNWVGSG